MTSLYFGFALRKNIEYKDFISGLLKLKTTVFLIVNVIFLIVIGFDLYNLIVNRIFNNVLEFLILLDDNMVTTSVIYFCSMLYVTVNLTIPIVHIILAKRILFRVSNKILEVKVYNQIDNTSETAIDVPSYVKTVNVTENITSDLV
jgi:hypothetical protein